VVAAVRPVTAMLSVAPAVGSRADPGTPTITVFAIFAVDPT
jgi:hypothetical protein